MTDDKYRTLRRPALEKAGLDPQSIDYLLGLEQGHADTLIATVAELSRTAKWVGRRAKLATTGIELVWDGLLWRLA
jgi:hypothetical protein